MIVCIEIAIFLIKKRRRSVTMMQTTRRRKKVKILSFILALAILATMVLPTGLTVFAAPSDLGGLDRQPRGVQLR